MSEKTVHVLTVIAILILIIGATDHLLSFDYKQKQLIKRVYSEAKKYTDYPSTITAICGVESSYGKNILGDDRQSLGPMQIQPKTARWIASLYKELNWILYLPKKELETVLLTDFKTSVMVACFYFEHYRRHKGYFKAVSVYNGTYTNKKYVDKVNRMKKEIRSYL